MKILLIGCGKMGGALLKGWLDKNISAPENFYVVDPGFAAHKDQYHAGVQSVEYDDLMKQNIDFDAIVFAIKPQMAADILPQYSSFVSEKTIFISIMAGVSIENMKLLLDDKARIIRTMPNIAAAIHKGVSVLYTDDDLTNEQAHLAYDLLKAVGDATWIHDEEKLHLITALSGSGPAYFYAMVESLIHKAEELGLEPSLAENLAVNTFIGSAELLAQSDNSPTDLRIQVTSPGGTTEAALHVLLDNRDLSILMKKALEAAANRSKELS